MNAQISAYIQEFELLIGLIDPKRKQLLDEIAGEIASRSSKAKLNFICTHNSRRSHMSQIWAATYADYFGLSEIETFSGGTEVTAMNVRVVNALLKAGFSVVDPRGTNPKYEVAFDRNRPPIICYSKVYDAPENPQSHFIALMTCSEADESCPNIPNADKRYPLYYNDPKEADDTPWEGERYEERLKQIGVELYYLFSKIK
ncbi:low molecular weight phosphatase family protein [Marinoscillum sp. MHG1-6]|uniref:arsenate-mycothiol transferase ArsC n=1 Tax=Marinoscillum sp. MHG1-6 TaxID=2959627 RepID=UPI00215869DC|nr:protein-tyrosine-phosphatase [Marinoscillum sp. MHG1-6]